MREMPYYTGPESEYCGAELVAIQATQIRWMEYILINGSAANLISNSY